MVTSMARTIQQQQHNEHTSISIDDSSSLSTESTNSSTTESSATSWTTTPGTTASSSQNNQGTRTNSNLYNSDYLEKGRELNGTANETTIEVLIHDNQDNKFTDINNSNTIQDQNNIINNNNLTLNPPHPDESESLAQDMSMVSLIGVKNTPNSYIGIDY
ncbi:unnamed protein product [[Candida] boidinii]|uniref:Unnamed protein product n=1 Tax=Candida boidinii TaxID=5477 RepID=A0ACB5U174_CANBO|nr:unnamed protein product [[Candida] boidinii]